MAQPTLIYLSDAKIAASYGSHFVARAAEPDGDIGRSIEALLASLPARSKNVYVLSTDVWSQPIPIESRTARRIDARQISQALAFEAQELSGLAVNESRTAAKLLVSGPIETFYWVSQIESDLYSQAADAIHINGGRLAGIQHPAGLPRPLNDQGKNWTRLEVWQGLEFMRSGDQRGNADCHFPAQPFAIPIDPQEAVDAELGAGTSSEQSVEVFFESRAIAENSPGIEAVVLDDDAALERFLKQWAKSLKQDTVPMIRPLRQPASPEAKRKVALLMCVAAIVVVALHFNLSRFVLRRQVSDLREAVTSLREPITEYNSAKKKISETEKKLGEAREERDKLKQQFTTYKTQIGTHRGRVLALLKTLSDRRPYDLIIRNLTCDGNRIRVKGRSVSAQSAARFGQVLAEELRQWNLSVEIPQMEALVRKPDGSPYEFEYVIRDRT